MLDLFQRLLPKGDTSWSWHYARDPVDLVEGAFSVGWVWRRRVNGKWVYRAMTPAEAIEAEWDRAIK